MDMNPPGNEHGSNRDRTAATAPTMSLAVLVMINAMPMLSINIYLPSIPDIVSYFRTDIPTVQYALSLYLLFLAIGQLAYGPLSDRFGRRPVLLVGISVYCAGSLMCALAHSIELLLLGRVLQASGAAAGVVIGRAMVRDVHGLTRGASMLGYTVMITTIATSVAPLVGGTLNDFFGWQAPFLFLTGIGLAVLVVCFLLAKETATLTSWPSSDLWSGYWKVLGYRSFWRFLIYSSLLMASYFSFIAGAPIVVVELWGYSPTSFGAWWTVGSFSYFIGNYVAGRYSERLGTEGMLRIGMPIIIIGAAALMTMVMVGPHHPLALFIPIGIVFIGTGVSQPSAMSSAINVDPQNIGSASGLLGCMQILLGILAISLLGLFPSTEPVYFGIICSGTLVLGVLINTALKRR